MPEFRKPELLYQTTDPMEIPLVMPTWARQVPELAALIDEGHKRRAESPYVSSEREIVIGAGSPETSALTHCPTCGAPEWHEDGRRGWNPVDVECEDCAGTYDNEEGDGDD